MMPNITPANGNGIKIITSLPNWPLKFSLFELKQHPALHAPCIIQRVCIHRVCISSL